MILKQFTNDKCIQNESKIMLFNASCARNGILINAQCFWFCIFFEYGIDSHIANVHFDATIFSKLLRIVMTGRTHNFWALPVIVMTGRAQKMWYRFLRIVLSIFENPALIIWRKLNSVVTLLHTLVCTLVQLLCTREHHISQLSPLGQPQVTSTSKITNKNNANKHRQKSPRVENRF